MVELKVLVNVCRYVWLTLRAQNSSLLNLTNFFLCYLVAHLQERLDDYIKQWNGLVKVFRNERREGLIQARSIGAQKAKLGQVRASTLTSLSFCLLWERKLVVASIDMLKSLIMF